MEEFHSLMAFLKPVMGVNSMELLLGIWAFVYLIHPHISDHGVIERDGNT